MAIKNQSFKGASIGLASGFFWALDTILIGLVLSSTTFMSFMEIALVAPLLATFLHDFMSAIWMLLLMAFRGQLVDTIKKIKTRSGLFVMLAATLGGPVGMTFYVLAVQNIGASFTAVISSAYPAVGALFAFLLLKDKLSRRNWIGLLISMGFITLLSYSGNLFSGVTISIGLIFVLLCVFGWGMESVICAYGMKDDQIQPEQALLIRQLTSSAVFGFIIIPAFISHSYTVQVVNTSAFLFIVFIALAGTLSYVFYYKAIKLVGPVRAMGMNISYAAWAIILEVILLGADFSLKYFAIALMIILGSVLTVMQNKNEITIAEPASLTPKYR